MVETAVVKNDKRKYNSKILTTYVLNQGEHWRRSLYLKMNFIGAKYEFYKRISKLV